MTTVIPMMTGTLRAVRAAVLPFVEPLPQRREPLRQESGQPMPGETQRDHEDDERDGRDDPDEEDRVDLRPISALERPEAGDQRE